MKYLFQSKLLIWVCLCLKRFVVIHLSLSLSLLASEELNFFVCGEQNSYDAKKALLKDGMLLNNSLIVGVKPLDPVQRQAFAERLEQPGSMTTAPRMSSWGTGSVQASQRSYYVQRTDNGPRSTVLATPAKSTLSKFVDLVFGS